jgi:IS30 family transposase
MAHITNAERSEIAILLKKEYTHHDIADALRREQSTISREIERNSVNGQYDPRKAKVKARVRRMQSKYQGMKVRKRPELQVFIIEKLKEHWTPDVIAGHLKFEQSALPYVSAKGIYKWLYSVHGQKYCTLLCSQQLKPRQRRQKTERSMIPNRRGIEERPKEANDRSAFGHGETDTMVSGKRHSSKKSLAVLEERKTRYVRLRKILNLKPATMARALKRIGQGLKLSTITFDNGIENRNHEAVAVGLRIKTYFCNKYRSWEKGGVENTIGRIRRFIPKGADLADYTHADIARIEHWLNHTPRKCLNYKTPYDMMKANLLSISSHPSDAFEG